MDPSRSVRMGDGSGYVPNAINWIPISPPQLAFIPRPVVCSQGLQPAVRGAPIIHPVRNSFYKPVLAQGAWPTQFQQQLIFGSVARDVPLPASHVPATPVTVNCHGLIAEADLQQIRPEAVACVLPDLDKCHTSNPKPVSPVWVPSPKPVVMAQANPLTTEAIARISPHLDNREIRLQPKPIIPVVTNYSDKPSARPKQKVPPKPKAKTSIPKQLGRPRKPLPENTPLFTPLPMGARHVDPQARPWGGRMTKQMWAKKAVLQKPILQASRCGGTVKTLAQLITEKHLPNTIVTNSSTGVSNSLSVSNAVRSVKNVDEAQPVSKKVTRADSTVPSDKTTKSIPSAEEPNVVDEYEVEYLYLTKIILRKKKPTIPKPSSEQICRKRKFLEDNTEMWRRSKQTRMEPQNVAGSAGGTPGCLLTLPSDTRDF